MSAEAALRAIKSLHQGEPRRTGRKLAVGMVCRECGQASPCEAWVAANVGLGGRA